MISMTRLSVDAQCTAYYLLAGPAYPTLRRYEQLTRPIEPQTRISQGCSNEKTVFIRPALAPLLQGDSRHLSCTSESSTPLPTCTKK
jgi:hypothetical protein